MSSALTVAIVFGASVFVVIGVILTIIAEVLEEHEINVERRRLPIAHH